MNYNFSFYIFILYCYKHKMDGKMNRCAQMTTICRGKSVHTRSIELHVESRPAVLGLRAINLSSYHSCAHDACLATTKTKVWHPSSAHPGQAAACPDCSPARVPWQSGANMAGPFGKWQMPVFTIQECSVWLPPHQLCLPVAASGMTMLTMMTMTTGDQPLNLMLVYLLYREFIL